jgi:MFS transporter, DHA1 family, multidrug resistance protein
MQSRTWRRNLYAIAVAEFIVLLGFTLYSPLLPIYMQKLGGFSVNEAAFWSGIATGTSGLTMVITAPIWGVVADRWGRKPMLIRAQFGGAVIVALFLVAPNIYFLTGFRILQGIFTGTVAAASALIASQTPRDKLPYSMGILMGAVFAGQTIGPLVGGFLADHFGFQTAFIVTSCLLGAGGLMVLLLVHETFKRPEASERVSGKGIMQLAFSRQILPLLIVLAALSIGPQIILPILPLIISTLHPAGGAASAAGEAFALLGVITAISSLVFGHFNSRMSIRKVLIFCCIGTGMLYLPSIWAGSALKLILLVGMTGLLMGGIVTSSNSLVSVAVPVSQQGIAYGLSQSASALGAGAGPFLGGVLASVVGLNHVFGISSAVFLLAGLLAYRLIPGSLGKRVEHNESQKTDMA